MQALAYYLPDERNNINSGRVVWFTQEFHKGMHYTCSYLREFHGAYMDGLNK